MWSADWCQWIEPFQPRPCADSALRPRSVHASSVASPVRRASNASAAGVPSPTGGTARGSVWQPASSKTNTGASRQNSRADIRFEPFKGFNQVRMFSVDAQCLEPHLARGLALVEMPEDLAEVSADFGVPLHLP